MSTNKKNQEKYSEPFKITVNKRGRNKSELSVQEVKPFAPTIPVIDLTPAHILLKYDKEKLINKFAGIFLSIILLVASVWGINFTLAGLQSNANANTQTNIDALQKQLGDVEAYKVYADGIKLVRENMYDVIKNNIDMSIALDAIVDAANKYNVRVTTIKITETATTTEQNICINSDPFKAAAQIGCVSISGTAKDSTNVISFFDEILKTEGYEDSFINSIGVSGENIVFSGTVSMTNALKIKRYNYLSTELVTIESILGLGGLSEENIAKLLAGDSKSETTATPTPTPAPSVTPTPTETAAAVNDKTIDAKFDSCSEVIAAGYGPYDKTTDAEYAWYQAEDKDNDGMVCES